MTKYTSTVLFAGAGLMDFAITASGGVVTQAIENDPTIAACYRHNFPHVKLWVQRIEAIDPEEFEPTQDVHGSPSCVRASVANSKGETEEDIQPALAFLNIVRSMHRRSNGTLPLWVTVENVAGYAKFQSFKLLRDGLLSLGYCFCVQELDAADLGVPQHRKRLWARFALPNKAPNGTIKTKNGGMIPPIKTKLPHVGWYQAIAHLIPSLPPSGLAEWQKKKLLVKFGIWTETLDQSPTVSETLALHLRMTEKYEAACLIERVGARSACPQIIPQDKPAFTVRALGSDGHYQQMNCWLVDGRPSDNGKTVTAVSGEQPSYTVVSSTNKQTSRLWMPNSEVKAVTPSALWYLQMHGCDRAYNWPDGTSNVTKCRGIGNGIPYLMGLEIKKSLVGKREAKAT